MKTLNPILENRMETTVVYWDYIGAKENEMETTIVYWGYVGIILNFVVRRVAAQTPRAGSAGIPGTTQLE